MSLQLRVLQSTQIEERLERVEKQLAESEAAVEKIEKAKNEEARRLTNPTARR
jgi:hypothetical protein